MKLKTLVVLAGAFIGGQMNVQAAAGPISSASRSTIRIALVGPLTEVPQSPIGRQVLSGAKLFVEQLNRDGGVAGKAVELLAYDDHFRPDETAAQVSKAIRVDGVVAVMTVGTAPALRVITKRFPEDTQTPLFPLGPVQLPFGNHSTRSSSMFGLATAPSSSVWSSCSIRLEFADSRCSIKTMPTGSSVARSCVRKWPPRA